MARVIFTRHAKEKFDIVRSYGFEVSEETVIKAVNAPDRTLARGSLTFSSLVIDEEFALRVVHEERKGIIMVITFYPIKRKRYGL